jgi:hypothetical protein
VQECTGAGDAGGTRGAAWSRRGIGMIPGVGIGETKGLYEDMQARA